MSVFSQVLFLLGFESMLDDDYEVLQPTLINT
jgi:hypothetical protein